MKVMIAAGGTGGHVNPALAVAGEIKKRHPEAEICFVGTADRIESKIMFLTTGLSQTEVNTVNFLNK